MNAASFFVATDGTQSPDAAAFSGEGNSAVCRPTPVTAVRECPSCEGTGAVMDMAPKEPRRICCPTCAGQRYFDVPDVASSRTIVNASSQSPLSLSGWQVRGGGEDHKRYGSRGVAC